MLLRLIVVAIVLRLAAQLALAWLNAREVRRHETAVPEAVRGVMDDAEYRRSVAYTLAKNRFGIVTDAADAVLLVLVLVSGVLPWAWEAWLRAAGSAAPWSGALFLVLVSVALSVPGLPFEWWAQFRLEARFGFNRSTLSLWVTDRVKGLVLTALIGMPLLWLLLQLVVWIGALWWVAAWAVFMTFQLVLIVLYPLVILPWFNTLRPLPEGDLRARLLALADRARFPARTIQVMDGSRRSTHSNAFFTGLGRFRRIVLFDTLVDQLTPEELEAVLAHEIAHYRLGHIPRMLALSAAVSLGVFGLIGWLAATPAFFSAFGFDAPHPALALLLFGLLAGVAGYWLAPLGNLLSRRHEYEADAFARRLMDSAAPLRAALRKLTRENLSNLTPHWLYSAVYYSHPTLVERERGLE
jgi:STE24 endopeptidase